MRHYMRICHNCYNYDRGYEVCKKKAGTPHMEWDDTCTMYVQKED